MILALGSCLIAAGLRRATSGVELGTQWCRWAALALIVTSACVQTPERSTETIERDREPPQVVQLWVQYEWTVDALSAGEVGDSIAVIGDVDDDGLRDLVVASPVQHDWSSEAWLEGFVHVLSSCSGAQLYALQEPHDHLPDSIDQITWGMFVTRAPDLDADGCDDFYLVEGAGSGGWPAWTNTYAISARRKTQLSTRSGYPPPSVESQAQPSTTDPLLVRILASSELHACRVGDVDGDGVSDFLRMDGIWPASLRARVFSGRTGDVVAEVELPPQDHKLATEFGPVVLVRDAPAIEERLLVAQLNLWPFDEHGERQGRVAQRVAAFRLRRAN